MRVGLARTCFFNFFGLGLFFLGLGFGFWGLGFGVWDLGFGVWGLGAWGLGCRGSCFDFTVSGLVIKD